MARFLSRLVVSHVSEPGRVWERASWELLEDLRYESDVPGVGTVRVRMGFVTDYASVPRLIVSYAFAGDSGHKAAVVHDWLYRDPNVTRRQADCVFLEALAVSGCPAWRRYPMFWAVRAFGWLAHPMR